MRFTIKQVMGASAALVIGAGLLAACTSSSGGGEKVISERKALMKTISKDFKPIKAYVKGSGSSADVVKYANAINASAKKIPALFPKGTARGDYPDKVTRALPAIWKDWPGFEKATADLERESAKLAAVAATGDKAAIAKQAGMMGKIGCGGCHKPFRGPKAK